MKLGAGTPRPHTPTPTPTIATTGCGLHGRQHHAARDAQPLASSRTLKGGKKRRHRSSSSLTTPTQTPCTPLALLRLSTESRHTTPTPGIHGADGAGWWASQCINEGRPPPHLVSHPKRRKKRRHRLVLQVREGREVRRVRSSSSSAT
ncbi:hypothetical protein B0H12DRAFT_1097227 [Mycena haematopus]|nr:hypothetical protein B0H12DRAFT_1097227 [Mycena haematopus]